MIIHSISDIHIRDEHDTRVQLLLNFIEQSKSADYIILLGDIFDIMVGCKKEYLKKYQLIFNKLKEATCYQKVIYVQGNHDFHLKELLEGFFNSSNFIYEQASGVINYQGKIIHYAHGDDIDQEDQAYRIWKRVYSHTIFRRIIVPLIPFKVVEWLGKDASEKSRNRSYSSIELSQHQKRFEMYTREYIKQQRIDYLFLGHSHLEKVTSNYINNGFCPVVKKFSCFNNGQLSLIPLTGVESSSLQSE